MNKNLEKEIQKNIKTGIKKIPSIVWIAIPLIIVLCTFGYAIKFRINSQDTGGMLGENFGTIVGRAMGSLDGLTRGQVEGYAAGKEEGLSAKDTTAEIATKIQDVKRLEVLVASGIYSDIIKIGEDPVDYAALLSQKYNAVFTVDLGTAEIELRNDGLYILLDQPVVDFITDGEIEKKNEFQRKGFIFDKGSAEAGYKAADNSMNEIPKKAEEKLRSDESLMEAARNSAVTQLTQIVNAVSLSKPSITVEFREDSKNG